MNSAHTTTALGRWSCQNAQLPPISQIEAIHVYDFDNTLFASPLPSKHLWNSGTYGRLQAQDFLYKGGWWHNPRILAAVGQGVDEEEPRAWEGCWNEKIVDLVRLSMADEKVLSILLTGRQEIGFAELIGRMVSSKGLEFHMTCLKPTASPSGEVFSSTMSFKQALLRDTVLTYHGASELRMYEDRVKHVKGFRDFFAELNMAFMSSTGTSSSAMSRKPFVADVIQVSEQELLMQPESEITEVQRMVNIHNQAVLDRVAPRNTVPYKIKRSVFYTGYILSQPDVDKLRTMVQLPPNCPEHEVKYLANSILIVPRPAPASILEKVGGMGAKLTWRVTGLAVYEQRVWAARVQPVIRDVKIHTENPTPCVVLATRRQVKPFEASRIRNWQPVPEHQTLQFETTVGEKVLLRIEEEVAREDAYEASFPNARNTRKHTREEDFPPLSAQVQGEGRPAAKAQQRTRSTAALGSSGSFTAPSKANAVGFTAPRGGGGNPRGGGLRGGSGQQGQHRGRGGGSRNTGRGRGRGGYRSLDDSVSSMYGGKSEMQY